MKNKTKNTQSLNPEKSKVYNFIIQHRNAWLTDPETDRKNIEIVLIQKNN